MYHILLKLVLCNFPLLACKIIFLMDRDVFNGLDLTSNLLSIVITLLSAIIFSAILTKQFEEHRYSFKPKGRVLGGCLEYTRLDLEEYLNEPANIPSSGEGAGLPDNKKKKANEQQAEKLISHAKEDEEEVSIKSNTLI